MELYFLGLTCIAMLAAVGGCVLAKSKRHKTEPVGLLYLTKHYEDDDHYGDFVVCIYRGAQIKPGTQVVFDVDILKK